MIDSILEEGAVGERRQGVVERLVDQLILEGLLLADVARVENEAADARVLEEVRDRHLGMTEMSVTVSHGELEHSKRVRLGRRLR